MVTNRRVGGLGLRGVHGAGIIDLPLRMIVEPMDLARFDLNDMIECGRALRKASESASSMEEAACAIVRFLRGALVDRQTGEANCALVRCFKTHSLQQLPPELTGIARGLLTDKGHAQSELPCLTLLATAGDLPPWNDRGSSRGHAVIPLESVEIIERAPMIASLLRQMGLRLEAATESRLILDADQHTFNVFHVEHAQGNASIPAQSDFVRPYGVRSVLGFGGLLPGGELYRHHVFTRHDSAGNRRHVSHHSFVGKACAPALCRRTCVRCSRSGCRPPVENEPEQMQSEIATLHLLISALEEAALRQTEQLKAAFGELQKHGELAQQQSARDRTGARTRTNASGKRTKTSPCTRGRKNGDVEVGCRDGFARCR